MHQQNVIIFSLFFFQQLGRVILEDVSKNSLVKTNTWTIEEKDKTRGPRRQSACLIASPGGEKRNEKPQIFREEIIK